MEKWKQIFRRLLFPRAAVLLTGIPIGAALLIYTFAYSHEDEPIAYFSYVLSAYITTAVCARLPGLIKGGSALVHQNPYLHRYLTDIPFRTHVSLYLSLGINLLYAVMKLFCGAYYRSVWFGTFGVYYALLTVMRFLLLGHVKRNALGQELVLELKRYRLCGVILIPMTIAMSGVVELVIEKDEGFVYAGYLIYVVAMYAFYSVISAIADLIKYRKYQSPVLSAVKVIRLAAALVSILSLETAMLSQFGDGSDPAFRRLMTAATGAGVCAVIFGLSIYMIVHGTRQLEGLRTDSVDL